MLYDQAQLVGSYVDAYQITHDAFYADIARRTCDYVLRDMTGPDGAFYSAEDADSEGVEGKFYVWTRAEIEQVLRGSDIPVAFCVGGQPGRGKNAAPTISEERIDAFCRAYGDNILHVTAPGDFSAERALLFAAREKRVRPHRDEKILTAWNGLMISALARLGETGAAGRAARYILTRHHRDGELWRTPTVPAMLEDYAFFATGLVDLYEATFDPSWLSKAGELADQMMALFYDNEAGGFFQTDGQDASVIIRSKDNYDGAEPSGNAMATLLLLRLGEKRYRQAAEKTLTFFGALMRATPAAVPQMLCALDWMLSPPLEITITGEDAGALAQVVRECYLPNKVLRRSAGSPSSGRATAQICRDGVCEMPTADPSVLRIALTAAVGSRGTGPHSNR
jgi:uncharacterized protein YyaL (SSP411 family)